MAGEEENVSRNIYWWNIWLMYIKLGKSTRNATNLGVSLLLFNCVENHKTQRERESVLGMKHVLLLSLWSLCSKYVSSDKTFSELRGGMINLWLYKENNTLRDWKNVFTLYIPLWAPHTYDFVVLTSLTHPRKIILVVLQTGKPNTYQHPYVCSRWARRKAHRPSCEVSGIVVRFQMKSKRVDKF
jgi:hypothetical protein